MKNNIPPARPTGKTPLGWREVGFSGSKAKCLTHIHEVWTDMPPLSIRKKNGGGQPLNANGPWFRPN